MPRTKGTYGPQFLFPWALQPPDSYQPYLPLPTFRMCKKKVFYITAVFSHYNFTYDIKSYYIIII